MYVIIFYLIKEVWVAWNHHTSSLLQIKQLIFWHFVPQMCTQPNWLCHQFIITKQNMKIFSPKMIMAPIIHKKSCNSFKIWQCDWKHSNTHVMMSLFFWFEILHKCEKYIWKKEYLITFFLGTKKVIRFAKS
jgi:hypothetical protein